MEIVASTAEAYGLEDDLNVRYPLESSRSPECILRSW